MKDRLLEDLDASTHALSLPYIGALTAQVKALEKAVREETAAGQTPDAATQEALQQVWRWLNFPVVVD